jgi:hypothetical protein
MPTIISGQKQSSTTGTQSTTPSLISSLARLSYFLALMKASDELLSSFSTSRTRPLIIACSSPRRRASGAEQDEEQKTPPPP